MNIYTLRQQKIIALKEYQIKLLHEYKKQIVNEYYRQMEELKIQEERLLDKPKVKVLKKYFHGRYISVA